jgi:hypothetical protein
MNKEFCLVGVHRTSRRFAMFKPLSPCHATIATCDQKAATGLGAPKAGKTPLLRAQFSAELTKLLAQLVTLR